MVSPEDKLASVEREIKMRRRVYPGWVAKGATAFLKQVAAKPTAAPR